jgi:predicted RNA-binding Zn-ribbon protein involved in translation (DUF1610 family)
LICANCNDHNYSFRDFCRKCFYTKTGEKKAIVEGKNPGDWHCQSCAHLNYIWRTECQKCQRKKPWSAEGNKGKGLKNPNDWMCPNCGDHVFASRSICRKCSTPKHAAVMRGMGMMGSNSAFGGRQMQGQMRGQMQGQMRGQMQGQMRGQMAGDWNCTNCGDMQYAFRTECRKRKKKKYS